MESAPLIGPPGPLRIAMVLDSWDDEANGAVVSTRRFSELLRRRGHEVTVISCGAPAPGKIALPPFRVPLADGIMRKMRFTFAWPDRRVLEPALSAQDVVHVQFPFYLGVRAVALARELGRPVISTFHVQAEHLLYNVGIRSDAWVDRLYRLFLRTVYDRCDHVVCPSAFAEAELRRRGLRAPTTVISNGVPPEFVPVPRPAESRFAGRFVILCVGRLAREKRQDLLIEAIRRSRHEKRIQLVILGDGPRKEHLRELGRTLTHPPIFDFVKTEELVPYYGAADLCVHAAEVEVECMSVLEAMACGLPCLIARSDRSATSQFALSEAFLFESGSASDLTDHLDRLIADPAALTAARAASSASAAQYRIEASLQKLLGVYASVMAQAGHRPRPARRSIG